MADEFKPENWTVSSNQALKLSLVDDDGIAQFPPTYTYPIYGDTEQIFGYKELSINLAFDSVTFKPLLTINYTKKLDQDLEDIKEKLLSFLPDGDVIFGNEKAWIEAFQHERKLFTLPDEGSIVSEYSLEGNRFAIYQLSLVDEQIKRLHRRMQIFALLFIESASYIDESDDTWELFVTFNKHTRQCIGYTTTYTHWRYMGADKFDSSREHLKRAKISQFIILPPYQAKNHGSKLYNAVFDTWLRAPKITEVTVEDPNEAFDDLRDRNDLKRLHNIGFFSALPQEAPISKDWLEEQALKYKLDIRQFMRLVEMILLHNGSPIFRLQVMNRIYEKNCEFLSDMDTIELREKLQGTVDTLKSDYQRILNSAFPKKHGCDSPEDNEDKTFKRLKVNAQ